MTRVVRFPGASGASGSARGGPARGGRLPEWESPRAMQRGQPYVTPRHVPRPLSREQRFVFDDMARAGLTALWVAGDLDGPQAVRIGDNRGAWPVLMGLSQAWADSKSPQLIAAEPYRTRAVMMRLWAETWEAADKIWCATYESLRHKLTQDTRGEWLSFDPDTTLGDISAHVLTHAASERIHLRTDDEVLADIDLVIGLARKMQREGG